MSFIILLRSQQPKAAHHSIWPGPSTRSLLFQAKGKTDKTHRGPWHPPPGLIWFAGAWIVFGVTRVLHSLCHVSLSDARIFFDILHIRVQILSHTVTYYKKHRKTSICFQSQPKVPIDGVYSTKDARTAQGILYKSQTLNTNSSNDSNRSQVQCLDHLTWKSMWDRL